MEAVPPRRRVLAGAARGEAERWDAIGRGLGHAAATAVEIAKRERRPEQRTILDGARQQNGLLYVRAEKSVRKSEMETFR